jgi:hypothetical protein
MAITKKVAIDQITIIENGTIFYREATRILEDGEEISKKYHRTSLTPGQDITNQPQKLQDICNTVWTPGVIAAYQQQVAEQAANRPGAN